MALILNMYNYCNYSLTLPFLLLNVFHYLPKHMIRFNQNGCVFVSCTTTATVLYASKRHPSLAAHKIIRVFTVTEHQQASRPINDH